MPDGVDHLVVQIEEIGRRVLPESLALDHLLDQAGLQRYPRRGIEAVTKLLDVVSQPHPVDRTVGSVERPYVGGKTWVRVRVGREPVVGTHLLGDVPSVALGAPGRGVR